MKKSKLLAILSLVIVMVMSLMITACGDLAIKEIKMDSETFTGEYVVGEEIDYSKMNVIVTYEDNSTSTHKLTDEGFSYTPIDTATVGTKEFKVSIKGVSIVLNVKVNPALSSIEVFNGQTEYVEGDVIDYSKIMLKVVYGDDSEGFINLTTKGVTYNQIDTSIVGEKTLNIEYQGKTTTLKINVKAKAVLDSIEIFNAKTNYALNEEIDYSAIILTVNYSDGTEGLINLATQGVTYNKIDTSVAGEKTLTVTYQGKTCELVVKVNEPTVKSIEVVEGVKAEYKVGETINASEIKLKVVKDDADSTVEYVYLNDEDVSYSVDLTSQGDKVLSITYGGVTVVKVISVIAVLESIEFDYADGLVVDYKSAIDYSDIYFNAIYNDANANEKVYLDAEDVEIIDEVDTNELGKHTLTVSYQGKVASIQVEVIKADAIKLTKFSIPQSYIDFKDASAVKDESLITDTEFAIKGKPYIVGNVNRFKFAPTTEYFDMDLLDSVEVENPVTTYVLQLKGENGEYATVDGQIYIESIVNNMYKFSADAEGKEFKLIVSPDKEIYDLSRWNNVAPTATIEFKVEKAYNVYDVYGLSVMDNLNVKNWAKIKDRTLVYDDKKLSEYTDVTLVVLHNDISVDADKLPSNYFWSENTPYYDMALANAKEADKASGNILTFAKKLKGSLRDGYGTDDLYNHNGDYYNSTNSNIYDEDGDGIKEDYNEYSWRNVNMQKGIFNTSQCSISGNYMTVTTKDSATRSLTTVMCYEYKSGDKLKMFNPISHWSMFKFYKTGTEELNINVENVFLQGNMPKVNDSGLPAGLMGINTLVDELTVDNVVTSQFYTHIICDEMEGVQSKLNFKNSRMKDAYSNMIYLWRAKVEVENCIMKNAGGPLFILCDGERPASDPDGYEEAVLNIDTKSVLESYAAGSEAWYTIFDATALFTQLKNMNALCMNMKNFFKAANPLLEGYGCNKSYVHNVNGAEQLNLIAVVIPSPGVIMTPRSDDDLLHVKGKVIRGEEEFDINAQPTSVIKSFGSVAFTSGGQYAFMPTTSSIAPFMALASQGVPGADQVPCNFNNSSDWLSITMSASSLGATNAPYFNVIIGDFKNV